jgi:ATP-dependent exoDNAse (exonuclease V) alpha subunit
MNEFLHRLKKDDRVLLVGDTRQHQAVEAGQPYQQLQEAGIQTARLDEIIRQKDPALKDVVEKLSRGQVTEAMEKLDANGRVHEIFDRDERIAVIAHEYMRSNPKVRSSCRLTTSRGWQSTKPSTMPCRIRTRCRTSNTG